MFAQCIPALAGHQLLHIRRHLPDSDTLEVVSVQAAGPEECLCKSHHRSRERDLEYVSGPLVSVITPR